MTPKEAREHLLKPLSDEEAAGLPLITAAEIRDALRKVRTPVYPRSWKCRGRYLVSR